jgi:homogentisate 1,2-dioxygenase
MNDLGYLSGFGNEFSSEALPGALPVGQFSPQRAPYGLYAEKFSLTAFTAPRAENRRTWFYRIRPSVTQGEFAPIDNGHLATGPIGDGATPPNPLRWDPLAIPAADRDFIDGLMTVAANGSAADQFGIGVHVFLATRDMGERYFYDCDGELLLVPQEGGLAVHTECGRCDVQPGEIVVVPRGMKFKVDLADGPARGFVCENYGQPLRLPERGPAGSDGFANDRDFLSPVAHYDDRDIDCQLVCKFGGRLFGCVMDHSPLDVVAWTGNAVPYKYALERFNVLGSVSYDHPDPSIYTVLTSPSEVAGVANADFVIFPPRWLVAEHTFRPPWFHRNGMSEFMGLIYGQYDAKKGGFEPGGMSLHNAFVPHGPDTNVFNQAADVELAPQKLADTMAFMFETRYVLQATRWALEAPELQADYRGCWSGLGKRFTGEP